MLLLAVGDRVEDARGQRGTVRYIGPVATSKDSATVYYGVCLSVGFHLQACWTDAVIMDRNRMG
jgi:hypothetical protein